MAGCLIIHVHSTKTNGGPLHIQIGTGAFQSTLCLYSLNLTLSKLLADICATLTAGVGAVYPSIKQQKRGLFRCEYSVNALKTPKQTTNRKKETGHAF